jgi:hypothetical protein
MPYAFLLLILLFVSCQSQKQITSSKEEKKEITESRSSTTQSTQTNEQQSLKHIIEQNNDRGTILSFDSIATVTIHPSGAITATGSNPRVQHFDRSKRSDTIEAISDIITEEDITHSQEETSILEDIREDQHKTIKRTNLLPFIIPLFVCLIIIWFLYLLWIKYFK